MSISSIPPTQQHSPQHRAALAALLALALICAQSLGLWHRLVHLRAPQTITLEIVEPAATDVASTQEAGLFAKLFFNHHGDSDCQSFDHASHGEVMWAVSPMAVALGQLPFAVLASQGLAVAHWHAQFQARAPPSVR